MRRCRPLLGTYVELTAGKAKGIQAAFAAIERVHRLMSAHEPESDVARINCFAHIEPVRVDGWTARMLERALFWSRQSEGAFDVVRAGKAALEHGLIPRHLDQPEPVAAHWTWLEIQGATVRLSKPGCIDLGGIAKGFAVDLAIAALKDAGCERGLVNAGGDLRGFGPEPWPVTIVHPRTRAPLIEVELRDQALATSAGLPSGFGLLSFDHLGLSRRWISVSVLAGRACDADALTKIIWANGADIGAMLADVGAKALAVTETGEIEAVGVVAEAAA